MKTAQKIPTPAVGGALWLVWAVSVRPQWTAVLLLLSPFVLLPLGLRLAAGAHTGPDTPALRTLGSFAPAVAITAAASFVPDPGLLAALLSIPWLSFTVVVALTGAGRLLSRKSVRDAGVGADAGLMFVAVGGAWLTISRGGFNPLGFSDAIVQLTAVHFHYAGFALPIVTGFTASRLHRSALVPYAVIVGVPLTAVGITAGGLLEWVAATGMALAGLATAALLIQLAAQQTGPARWLTGTAGAALAVGMSLALGWSWSIWFGWRFLGLESMAATHGSLNALGFGLLGLIGLTMVASANPAGREAGVMSIHVGGRAEPVLDDLAQDALHHQPTNPVGLLNRPTQPGFHRKSWHRTAEHGDFAAAAEAIRQWRGHDAAGIHRSPAHPEIVEGQTLALAIPVGPISVTATSRITKVIDEPDRYGFVYATLPHHPQDGEESFIITKHQDGHVDITVTAVWRPSTLAARICPPLTHFLQSRAIDRYLNGIVNLDNRSRTATR